ncbi:unnamed protein product [Cochlearia groenlandica]
MARGSEWLSPLHPPDPPDPSSPLPLGHFPVLVDTVMGSPSSSTVSITADPQFTVQIPSQEKGSEKSFTIVGPKASSPLVTNRASCSSPKATQLLTQLASITPTNLPITIYIAKPLPNDPPPTPACPKTSFPSPGKIHPSVVRLVVPRSSTTGTTTSSSKTPPILPPSHNQVPPKPTPIQPPSLAEKLRKTQDRSLKRLAPLTFVESGRPRVLIPDEVFQQGASFLKEVCYFNGRAPPFTHIQSALNHLWGKGRRLEVHLNTIDRTVLVRVPNEFIRQKILEK